MTVPSRASAGGITFHRPAAFWFGVVAVTIGVVLHLPMYFGARDMHYVLAGMPMDTGMQAGMFLILGGFAASFYGLVPPGGAGPPGLASPIRIQALDEAKLNGAHLGLILVMVAAITIDVMKPVTLSFVVPGMTREYGLRHPVLNPHGGLPVALLPFAGILGTVIGSFLWGSLGDRIGRRASILLAAVIFIGTAICGAMPSYRWNLVMCLLMGVGVGGMLPITFTLLAETIPAKHRGWLMVLIGGDVAGAYIVTSWLASTIGAPDAFGWRILWLVGLPTGVLLVVLNRWIPESPRFLLLNGRTEEARAVMQRYGATVVEDPRPGPDGAGAQAPNRRIQLFDRHFGGLTVALVLFALAVGLVTFGFQLWIPSNLARLGFSEVNSARVLRDSAILGFPATFLIAWLYGVWSSKKTLILLGFLTAAALLGLVLAGDAVAQHRGLLFALLAVPITGISSVQAVLIAYASEVYPTRIRSRATGLAAGVSKVGGVLIILLVALAVAPPNIATTALIGAVPVALGSVAVWRYGVETRRRRLEEITAEELRA